MPRDPTSHRGSRAIERMVEHAPGTGALALWMPHRHVDPQLEAAEQAAVDAVAGFAFGRQRRAGPAPVFTDGTALHYRRSFESLPLAEQTGRVAHAVLHVALRHPQRFVALRARLGDADLALFTTCADAIVNSALAHLPWLRLPADAVRLEQLLAEALGIATEASRALLDWDVERLYRAIDDRRPRASGNDDARRDGPRSARVRAMGAGTAIDLAPDALGHEAPEAQAEGAREWSERLLRAHAADGEHSMLRTLIADLPRERTPWEQLLRTRVARALAPRREPSWSRPTRSWLANRGRDASGRRMPWEPGTSRLQRVPRLAVVVDVSGSVEDALMARFARELAAITRRAGAPILLIVGDDRVRRLEWLAAGETDALRDLAFIGGGATDFTPLLQAADTHHPDLGIVLTDLQGPVRMRPRWPVLWAVPEAFASTSVPFGRLLVLD
jgi:hypothetical protein